MTQRIAWYIAWELLSWKISFQLHRNCSRNLFCNDFRLECNVKRWKDKGILKRKKRGNEKNFRPATAIPSNKKNGVPIMNCADRPGLFAKKSTETPNFSDNSVRVPYLEMNGGSTASYLARTAPFASLCFYYFSRSGRKGALDFQGRHGITSVVRWKLRPVIFGVEMPQTLRAQR